MSRDSATVKGHRAAQILDDPVFKEALRMHEQRILAEMDALKLDGSNDHAAVELVRKMQAGSNFRMELKAFVKAMEAENRRDKRESAPSIAQNLSY